MKTDPTEITALTLIDKALELKAIAPDKSKWTLAAQNDNLPRLVRLRQLNVLLQIFTPEIFDTNDIGSGIVKLISGQFILQRQVSVYTTLFKLMDRVITSANRHPPNMRDKWTVHELEHNYLDIIKFKITINQLLKHNNGIMEISYPFFYPVILTDKISNQLDTTQIDEFLRLVIDPLDKTISKEKLILDHNYPTEDVYDIDLDWR